MEKTFYAPPALKHYIFHFLLASSALVFRIVGFNHVGITDTLSISVENRYHSPISYLRDRTRGLASATTRWHINGYLSR